MIRSEKTVEIKRKVKKMLDHDRYQHTLGVAYTAVCLAMKYGEDLERAYLAGILHDCAKNIPDENRLKLCGQWGISCTKQEAKNPQLLHAKMGAYRAAHEFGISDEGILNAVTFHTTGRPDMTLLEKIVFVSDYIEPNRDRAKNLTEIRKTAFEDLDRAVCMIAYDTVEYLRDKGSEMDDRTAETYEFYHKLTENKGIKA